MSGTRERGRIVRADIIIVCGCLGLEITLDFGGGGQGFGVTLDVPGDSPRTRRGTAAGCDFIVRLMYLFDADSFASLVGREAYALRDDPYGPILGLASVETGRSLRLDAWRREWGLDPDAG